MTRTTCYAAACAVCLVSGAAAAPDPLRAPPPTYRPGFESVSDPALRAWLGFLASAELEGRETGARGYDVAARYVASVLEGLSIAPYGAGGTYFQPFDLVRREMDLDGAQLTVRGGGKDPETLPLQRQLAVKPADDAVELSALRWKGACVFAGFGESAADDAPDDFHGLPLEGRIVLVLPRPGKNAHEDRGARLAGARRIAVISDERVQSRIGHGGREAAEEPTREPAPAPSAAPAATTQGSEGPRTVYISRAAADRIFARSGTSVEKLLAGPARPAPRQLDGVEVELEVKTRETRKPTRNVVGFLEGSDPALRGEVVAIGAHLDHVGAQEGKIYFGADDDASGVTAVLGVARAFALNAVRPRRSVLFLFFAGEEKGLLGSTYFAKHPIVPLDRMILEIQLDMVGRNEEVKSTDPKLVEKPEDNVESLHVVGSKRHSIELDPWINSVNGLTGLRFEYDEERVYERSDQYNFGSRGVPVVFFFAGFHPDYHQPTDTVEKINFPKLASVTRLVFALAFEVADRERRLATSRF